MSMVTAKRARYREGVEIIALNDEPDQMVAEQVYGQATTMLLAELFGKDREKVAEDVVKFRKKYFEDSK